VDGVEGLDVYRAHRAQIAPVITDMIMPKASGFDLYEAVRQASRTAKALFTSGYPAPHYRKSVVGDGNVRFITKPWTVSDLLGQVRAMLDTPA
jgi:two-component system cell cycle sensor histidine kinase/response regulator CckA